MALLSNLAAYDFGYISAASLLRRTENAMTAMESLERFRGHFYNWYDTQSLQPLTPLYVSSVDSGNLAASLVAVASGLAELPGEETRAPRVVAGLDDTVRLLAASVPASPGAVSAAIDRIEAALLRAPVDAVGLAPLLHEIRREAAELPSMMGPAAEEEALAWTLALIAQCDDFLEDLDGRGSPAAWQARVDALATRCRQLSEMEFEFLYDRSRELLSIGYNVAAHRRDLGCYDLLASEARLVSFLLIARGHLPQEHWFSLGRLLTHRDGERVLLSGGSFSTCWLCARVRHALHERSGGRPYPIATAPTRDARGSQSCYNAVERGRLPIPGVRGAGPDSGAARDGIVIAFVTLAPRCPGGCGPGNSGARDGSSTTVYER
jgi:hypothetical protein